VRAASNPKLTTEQWELVGQMNDAAYGNPGLDFETAAGQLGCRFSDTPEGRLFRKECKSIFDRERAE
jgi:hypothetical protein